jgi:hypothetical protein
LAGEYVFSDLCATGLRAIEVPSGDPGTQIGLSLGTPASFGEGEDGQIYVVDLQGGVFRLEELN